MRRLTRSEKAVVIIRAVIVLLGVFGWYLAPILQGSEIDQPPSLARTLLDVAPVFVIICACAYFWLLLPSVLVLASMSAKPGARGWLVFSVNAGSVAWFMGRVIMEIAANGPPEYVGHLWILAIPAVPMLFEAVILTPVPVKKFFGRAVDLCGAAVDLLDAR